MMVSKTIELSYVCEYIKGVPVRSDHSIVSTNPIR